MLLTKLQNIYLGKVQWVWVKGHAANLENERCDKLARLAIKEKNGIF